MEKDVELVVGTYEDYVVGYRHIRSSLDQTFAVRCHTGSVRTLTCSPNGSLILSSGYDDMFNVFNMKKRKLICTVEGSVNSAIFVGNSHVVCGSNDGNIYIYECKQDVALRKTLGGHKGPVVAIDAHPTNKILLSLSKDGTMRTWNLIKARCSYVTRITPDSHLIRWSKTGEKFAIAANNKIHLYNIQGSKERSFTLDKRVNHVEYLSDESIIAATDSGVLNFVDLKSGCHSKFEAHESRIKSIVHLKHIDTKRIRLATAASDGKIKLWSLSDDNQLKLMAETDTGARLTCMSASIVRSSIVDVGPKENGHTQHSK